MWEFDSLIPNQTAAKKAAVFSGHSAVGSALRSGRRGRGFKSRCSDQKEPVHIRVLVLFLSQRDLNRAAVRSIATKAPAGLWLARGSKRIRNVYRDDCRWYTFVCLSFFFVRAAGFEPTKTPLSLRFAHRGSGGIKQGFIPEPSCFRPC